MGYRLRYQAWVDWVPAGVNPGSTPLAGPGMPGGNAQTIGFFQNPVSGQYSSTFLTGDITTLTNAMASDMSTQLNAAITRIQNFSSGGG